MNKKKYLSLSDFLDNNPWPEERLQQGSPAQHFFAFDLDISSEEIWPVISDTSRLNRILGFPEITFKEINGRLYGTYRIAGINHEWEESPWEWEYGNYIFAERIFSNGLPLYLRMHFRLLDFPGGGCRTEFYFGFIPRKPLYRIILKKIVKDLEKRFRAAMKTIEGELRKKPEFFLMTGTQPLQDKKPAPVRQINTERVDFLIEALKKEGLNPDLVDSLGLMVKNYNDNDLYRIRPKAVSKKMGLDENAMLPVMLHATDKGLLSMTWDLICPHCRGVRKKLNHLWEVPKSGTCEACNIDFDATGLNSIEITFSPASDIRPVSEVLYCSAEPARKPHIRMQRRIKSGGTSEANPPLQTGIYRMRVQGEKKYSILDIFPEAEKKDIVWIYGSTPEEMTGHPAPVIRMENNDNSPRFFILEEHEADLDALRPRDIFNFQGFRDIFSDEYLPADISINVGIQNILMVDLVGSTDLYRDKGNAGAFSLVKRFFNLCHDIAVKHNGSIVKTMGDAALISFLQPLDSFRAALGFMARLDGADREIPLRARITLNRGPCLAVNLNSSIDYFGQTVNILAKLQTYADAGEIVITETIASDPGIKEFLEKRNFRLKSPLQAELKGPNHVLYWKIKTRSARG